MEHNAFQLLFPEKRLPAFIHQTLGMQPSDIDF